MMKAAQSAIAISASHEQTSPAKDRALPTEFVSTDNRSASAQLRALATFGDNSSRVVGLQKMVNMMSQDEFRSNQVDVVQARFHVIGEHHGDTDLRLAEEKQYCSELFGKNFYLENDYKLPGSMVAADSRALKGTLEANKALYFTQSYIIDEANEMGQDELAKHATSIINGIDSAKFEHEILKKNPDSRFQFESDRLAAMMPGLVALFNALVRLKGILNAQEETPSTDGRFPALIEAVKEGYKTLRDSVIVLHKISEPSYMRMKRELNKNRSVGMAKALIATSDDEVAKREKDSKVEDGVWKVGDFHIPEIRDSLAEEGREDLLSQVISEDDFNARFLTWFQSKDSVAYNAYMIKRTALGI